MPKALFLSLLSLLMFLVGCGSVACSCAAPMLGIFTDASMQVMVVQENSAADQGGVQVNDVLLDIRPARVGQGTSESPVSFANPRAAVDLISLAPPPGYGPFGGYCCPDQGFPLKLRVQRGEQTLEFDVTPSHDHFVPFDPSPANTSVMATPTPTPAPMGWFYF